MPFQSAPWDRQGLLLPLTLCPTLPACLLPAIDPNNPPACKPSSQTVSQGTLPKAAMDTRVAVVEVGQEERLKMLEVEL